MTTLIINIHESLGKTLWKMWFSSSAPTYLEFLNGLDYVIQVRSKNNTYTQLREEILTFETEQDKMFFLLKYS